MDDFGLVSAPLTSQVQLRTVTRSSISARWAIPILINIVSAAFTVDTATATIGEAILAAVGTVFGPWLWVGLAATLVFAAIYLFTTIIKRDCSG